MSWNNTNIFLKTLDSKTQWAGNYLLSRTRVSYNGDSATINEQINVPVKITKINNSNYAYNILVQSPNLGNTWDDAIAFAYIQNNQLIQLVSISIGSNLQILTAQHENTEMDAVSNSNRRHNVESLIFVSKLEHSYIQ